MNLWLPLGSHSVAFMDAGISGPRKATFADGGIPPELNSAPDVGVSTATIHPTDAALPGTTTLPTRELPRWRGPAQAVFPDRVSIQRSALVVVRAWETRVVQCSTATERRR